jgi:hypothetical protein
MGSVKIRSALECHTRQLVLSVTVKQKKPGDAGLF